MTRREVVSRLRHDLVEHFDDSVLYNRHLWNAFWTASRVLIQREADANKLKGQNIFKNFSIDTEEVNLYEDTCVPIECISCRAKVPKVVMSKTGMVYSFLGSPDMHTRYNIVSPSEFIVKSKIKGTPTRFAFLEGDYLYLSQCIPCLRLLAVPEDEAAASTDGTCSVMDVAVDMSDFLIEGALTIARESLSITLRKQYDHIPNKNAA